VGSSTEVVDLTICQPGGTRLRSGSHPRHEPAVRRAWPVYISGCLLGGSGNIPVTGLDLLVCGDEIADEDEDSHEHVLSDRDDIGPSDLSDSDTAVGLVGSVEVDVIGTDTSSDGNFQLLRLGQSLGGEVAGVETVGDRSVLRAGRRDANVSRLRRQDSRCSDDDFSIDELLVEFGVLSLFV
jgi:hypothetical protein